MQDLFAYILDVCCSGTNLRLPPRCTDSLVEVFYICLAGYSGDFIYGLAEYVEDFVFGLTVYIGEFIFGLAGYIGYFVNGLAGCIKIK